MIFLSIAQDLNQSSKFDKNPTWQHNNSRRANYGNSKEILDFNGTISHLFMDNVPIHHNRDTESIMMP